MLEIINKKHKYITVNTRVELANYIRVELKEFYFSAGCNVNLGIVPGLFMHFINDEDRWLFYVNQDKDGFPLLERKSKKSLLITNSSLSVLFFRRTRCSVSAKFPIKLTEAKMKDCPVYEIMLNKPIED